MSKRQAPALIFIFITLLIDVIGLGIIVPVIPQLIRGMTDGTVSTASRYGGLLMFAYAAMQFLFSPILGGLSDQYGRRPVLLISLFGFGIDYLFLAYAPTIGWLFLGRLLAGIAGASFTTGGAYIADISTPEKRAQNFGILGAAFGLGFIIGPVLGGILGDQNPRLPFFVAAGLSLTNWLYGYFILPESLLKENRRPFDWKRANPIGSLLNLKRYPVIMGLVASLLLIYIAGHATQGTWSYFTIERFGWNPKQVGYSLAFVGLMVAIVQAGLIRILIPKFGQQNSVYIGLSFYALGFMLFAFANQGWMMYAIMIPYAMGGLAGPAIQGIISAQVPANEQGELQGSLTSLVSITSIIGPLMMSNLFGYFTSKAAPIYFPGAAFMMGSVLTIISVLLAWRTFSKNN